MFSRAGPAGLLLILALAVLATIALDRAARRPDLAIKGLYLEAGFGALGRIALTFPGVGMLVAPTAVTRILLFLSVTSLTILRPARALPGRALWAAAILVPAAALLTDAVSTGGFYFDSRTFSLQHRLLFALGVTALWVTPKLELGTVVKLAKLVLGIYLVASTVAFAAGLPTAGHSFGAFLPGFDARVSGIFHHPNYLGPAALLYLLVEQMRPSCPRLRIPMVTLALGLLLASQSKTAWIAAVALALVVIVGRLEPRRALAGAAVLLALAVPATVYIGLQPGEIADGVPIAHIDTLTGRTLLWAEGMEKWREAPLAGRGTGVFLEVAEETGEPWMIQAHNEYVQALAENGLIGLAALLVYVGVLVRVAVRHAPATRYVSLALAVLLLLRTVTEVSLVAFELQHMTILALFFALEREADSPRSSAAHQPLRATSTRRTTVSNTFT